jgi:hypothetical protein
MTDDIRSSVLAQVNPYLEEINNTISTHMVLPNWKTLQFTHTLSAPSPLFTTDEQSKWFVFIMRYDMLSEMVDSIPNPKITDVSGKLMIGNLYLFKSALNDMRTMIFNNDDSIYFNRIHKIIMRWLNNKDHSTGQQLIVTDENGLNITTHFIDVLISYHKILNKLIKNSDLSFLYNAVLQHTDSVDSQRFINEYSNGMIQCTIIKCYQLCPVFINMLRYHRLIISNLMHIEMGELPLIKK